VYSWDKSKSLRRRLTHMGDQAHLDIVWDGVEAWNSWRARNRSIKPNLSEANLSGANLSRANLAHSVLAHSVFCADKPYRDNAYGL
jgi:hypothetical protein